MIARFVHERDIPLGPEALSTCQAAFDAVLSKLEIEREHEKADVVAALIVSLYQQGIHDEEKLFDLVMTASAKFKI